ncbi:hypothetical protein LMG24238_07220 [Paraburkholderia sediminicola]|uniref:Uncharacterized protein n=1 Tax=Paraburkholderia sediminicola TaxID=458836 RepID=A0A6J5CRZ4_9BURK|nr:hypothetical protein LMG24238_07220 [Paraburkholderia sediminicola]
MAERVRTFVSRVPSGWTFRIGIQPERRDEYNKDFE